MKRFLFCILALWPGWAWGVSDSIQFTGVTVADSNFSCEDALLYSGGGGDDNYGSDTYSGAGLRISTSGHIVIRFPNLDDLATDSSVTAAEVDSGRVWLYARERVASGSDSMCYGYHCTESWVEGTGTGSTTVGVSWTYRDSAVYTSWTTAGGSSNTTTNCSTAVYETGKYLSWKISKATCSTWVATPASNYGVLFKKTTAGEAAFNTSESGTAGERPKFTLYWTQGGGASTALTIGGGVTIGGNTVIGGK